MFKRRKIIAIGIILCLFCLNFIAVYSYQNKSMKVLLLYDQRNYFGYLDDIVTSFRELLGHFNVEVNEKKINDYKPNEINYYDYIFIVGLEGNFQNKDLIQDLKETRKTICWFGKGVENFLVDNKKTNIVYKGIYRDFISVSYRDKYFDLGVKREFVIIDVKSSDVRVFSWISDGKNRFPYILNEDNFWFISRIEIESILFYIIADMMQDIFDIETFERNEIYIRIEDVHLFRDVDKLKKIADYLYSREIPFMIALIPAYKDPKTGYVTLMSENQEFINTIKYMQDRGGSVVLHGYTHQAFGGEPTGEGYEFWDGIKNRPLQIDMNKWIHERIGIGIKECVKNGIYPLAFEAPHYAMSQEGYIILKRYFSTYIGHLQSTDFGFTTTVYPYKLHNTKLFNKFIPENLGYVSEESFRTTNKILENLSDLSIVRGFTAGLFLHPYLDIKYLKEIVENLENNNIKFYDLKKDEHWVKWENILITSKDGHIEINDYEKRVGKENSFEKIFLKATYILAVIVALICGILLIIFIKSKIFSNKNLFK